MNELKHAKQEAVSELDTIPGGMPEEAAGAAAAEQEAAAKAEPRAGTYVFRPGSPLEWEGTAYETLTFRWDSLTGRDHLAIETELLMKGRTLVVPEYTGDYLCGMAARAAVELRDVIPPQRDALLKALPLPDFMKICKSARSFLLHGER